MTDKNAREMLAAIEAADIACTRSHYRLLTDNEIEERQYRSCDLNGTSVYVETRGGQRVGRISGFGLTQVADADTLKQALDWLQSERPHSIRVRVAPFPENTDLVQWLIESNFKQTMRIQQWSVQTNNYVVPPISTRRRTTFHHEIREIGPERADIFARIVAINYRYKQGTDLGWLKRQVGAPGFTTFLAFEGDEPVGTGSMQGTGGICVLGYGTTLKAYRKRGIQNAMISERVRKGKDLGYQLAAASTFGTDQSSRNLRRQGFSHAGEVGLYSLQVKRR